MQKHFDGKQIIGEIIELDKKRRTTQAELDNAKAEANNLAKQIGQLMKEGKKSEAEAAKSQDCRDKGKHQEDGRGLEELRDRNHKPTAGYS